MTSMEVLLCLQSSSPSSCLAHAPSIHACMTDVDIPGLQNKSSDFCAPLTSFDWNETDPKRLGTSSIDTTCTIWDIEVQYTRVTCPAAAMVACWRCRQQLYLPTNAAEASVLLLQTSRHFELVA